MSSSIFWRLVVLQVYNRTLTTDVNFRICIHFLVEDQIWKILLQPYFETYGVFLEAYVIFWKTELQCSYDFSDKQDAVKLEDSIPKQPEQDISPQVNQSVSEQTEQNILPIESDKPKVNLSLPLRI